MSAVVLLAALTMLGVPSPAWAHTQLIGSSPAEGASLPVAPQQLQLTFNEPLQAGFSTITVTGSDSSQWTLGQPALNNTVLTVPVRQAGPAGQYTIGYRVLSADGHPVSGTVRFTLTGPVTATATALSQAPQPAPTTQAPQADVGTDGGGTPVWPWIVGAVVLLGIGLVIALRMGRSTDS
ncbi:copper resistance protein CopC [Actinophytocola sp. NPDC049390]|uniref:copper resistance protein CopC n=1 Tax=Actinophytocola sp. NPDC049390 TaxID=3363894 RepID=UPI003790CA80